MLIRDKSQMQAVEWGNGLSYRFLVSADNMGFTVTHTIVRAGTKSRLQYKNHLEACYCIAGKGEVISDEGDVSYAIEPGVLYALDQNDSHTLIASPDEDLHLTCVFVPSLRGDEVHSLDADGFSHY